MNPQEEVAVYCPYCNEPITLLIDCSESGQRYVEDCFVCCRPIVVSVTLATHEPLFQDTYSAGDPFSNSDPFGVSPYPESTEAEDLTNSGIRVDVQREDE